MSASYQPRPKHPGTCVTCGETFLTHAPTRKFCSVRCKDLNRSFPCSGCGKAMWFAASIAAVPMCQPCRAKKPKSPKRIKDKRAAGLDVQTWVCAGCGAFCGRPAVRGSLPKWCFGCRSMSKGRWVKISPSRRQAIYDRDDWTCWLCEEAVEATLIGSKSIWRPALDHVIPKSVGGLDVEANLRLAHWWCNSVRGPGHYAPEVFRAAS